jgi:hypothetical protein
VDQGQSVKVLLINASAPAYNLAIAKAHNYWQAQGAEVSEASSVPELMLAEFDHVWISAVFSWHVPKLITMAQTAQRFGARVEVGGPGTFGVRELIKEQTGLEAQSTPDSRFERQPGQYAAVFWSRGCPAKNCTLGFPRDGQQPVCSVPAMEGWRFSLYREVTPAPVILDNNLSALPREHQDLIVERTLSAGFERVDANSGFEPRSFRADTASRWRQLPLVAWRFAYDEMAERDAVLRMMSTLDDAGVNRKSRRIYCLAGNEPIEACEQRVLEIQSWRSLPIVQRRRPLNWIGGPLPTLFDWTEQKLIDFQRWGNRLSGGMRFSEYKPNLRERDNQTLNLF